MRKLFFSSALLAVAAMFIPAVSSAYAEEEKTDPKYELRACDVNREKSDPGFCRREAQAEVTELTKSLEFASLAIVSLPKALVHYVKLPSIESVGMQRTMEHVFFNLRSSVAGGDSASFVQAVPRAAYMRTLRQQVVNFIRGRYAEPDVLLRDFESAAREPLIEKIKKSGQQRLVAEALSKVSYLFEKPIDVVLARDAQEWYLKDCTDVDKQGDYFCAEISKSIMQRFASYYAGRKLDADAATVLGFLQRRDRENGAPLVSAWQKIFLSTLSALGGS